MLSISINAQDDNAISEIKSYQEGLNEQYKTKGESPLEEKDRVNFNGLDFFDIDLDYRVEANLTKTPNALPLMVNTSSGKSKYLIKYGVLHFTIKGKKLKEI